VYLSVSALCRRWGLVLLFSALVASTAPRPTAHQVPVEPRVIAVTAQRFEFVPATVDVVEGEHVRLLIRSADRVHGFGIKSYGIDVLVPRGGAPVAVEFVAARPGIFEILCTEDCGRGHDDMKGTLVVRAVAR
jgi:cytochrome c oxidase subunit II